MVQFARIFKNIVVKWKEYYARFFLPEEVPFIRTVGPTGSKNQTTKTAKGPDTMETWAKKWSKKGAGMNRNRRHLSKASRMRATALSTRFEFLQLCFNSNLNSIESLWMAANGCECIFTVFRIFPRMQIDSSSKNLGAGIRTILSTTTKNLTIFTWMTCH